MIRLAVSLWGFEIIRFIVETISQFEFKQEIKVKSEHGRQQT